MQQVLRQSRTTRIRYLAVAAIDQIRLGCLKFWAAKAKWVPHVLAGNRGFAIRTRVTMPLSSYDESIRRVITSTAEEMTRPTVSFQ